MESIGRRLDQLEALVDVDEGNRSIVETVGLLNNHINAFINSDPRRIQLFQNLNNSKIRFHYDKEVVPSNHHYDTEELELRRQYIISNSNKIEALMNNLKILSNMEQNCINNIDTSILAKSDKIVQNLHELHKLELKYNELLMRSVNILQNFLNLNNNMNRFYRQVELDQKYKIKS